MITPKDTVFFQDIFVSLQSDPLALKFKSHFNIPSSRDVQHLESHTPDSKVIDLESSNLSVPSLSIDRSHGGEMPQNNSDPRFQFRDGLLYYQ